MSKRLINLVVVILFCFFSVFLGLRIGYDTSLIDQADKDFEESNKQFEKDEKSTMSANTSLKYVDFDSVRF